MSAGTAGRAAGCMVAAGFGIGAPGLVVLALAIPLLWVADTGVTDDATATFAVAGGGVLAAAGAGLALMGLTLYVLLPSFSGPARAAQNYGSHRVVLSCTLLATAGGNILAILLFIPVYLLQPSWGGASYLLERLISPAGIAVAAVSLDVALLATVYLRIVRPGEISWSTMGLTRDGLGSRLLLGLLFGGGLFAVSALMESALSQFGVEQTQGVIFESVKRANLGEFCLVLLSGALIAPVVEEIFFRGFVFRAYAEKKGPWRAYLFSASLFSAVHLNLPAFLPIFAMGLLLAFFYRRTGSIIPSIVAHALNNGCAFTLLYLGLA